MSNDVHIALNSPDQTQSDNNISSSSTLDILNLTQTQLETQIRELSKRLQKSEDSRNFLERQLKDEKAEKDICLRRLDANECRITEMHCVIAELSKKLRAKMDNVIVEEQEDGSEASYQEGSIYNSELNLTNPDAECQTDLLESGDEQQQFGLNAPNQLDYFNIELNEQDIKLNEHVVNKGQIEVLQEEIFHLKAQIALLQSEIASTAQQAENFNFTENPPKKSDCYKNSIENDLDEENESSCSSGKLLFVQSNYIQQRQQQQQQSPAEDPLVVNVAEVHKPKMAERVKLRCVSQFNDEMQNDLNCGAFENIAAVDHQQSVLHLEQSKEIDNEFQRLERRIEHLKMQNSVLTLTLDECKEHCEHLYLLCGKYESNAIGLQVALNCSDRAIEAYDVMLALLESKLALIKEKTAAAEESRKAVESVARHLLDRLECEKNLCENSLGPWQSNFTIPEKLQYAPWTADDDNRLRYHVSKLKGCRSTVQNTIVNLESPFSDYYEKVRIAAFESGSELKNQERVAQLDLEMAVVMQELLNLREENFTFKMKVDSLLKERELSLNRICILEGALNQLQLQLGAAVDTQSGGLLFQQQQPAIMKFAAFENRLSYASETEHTALIEQQLVEALTRESELKSRIQTLIASVAAAQKTNDAKFEYFQSKQRELDSNINMAQELEQSKRKYQTRIRKLEQKISELTTTEPATCSSAKLTNDNVPETTL